MSIRLAGYSPIHVPYTLKYCDPCLAIQRRVTLALHMYLLVCRSGFPGFKFGDQYITLPHSNFSAGVPNV